MAFVPLAMSSTRPNACTKSSSAKPRSSCSCTRSPALAVIRYLANRRPLLWGFPLASAMDAVPMDDAAYHGNRRPHFRQRREMGIHTPLDAVGIQDAGNLIDVGTYLIQFGQGMSQHHNLDRR